MATDTKLAGGPREAEGFVPPRPAPPRTPGFPRQAPGRGTPPRSAAPKTTPKTTPKTQKTTPKTPKTPGSAPGRPWVRPAPRNPRTRPVTAPRHTRPVAGLGAGPRTGSATRPAGARPRTRSPQMPFILLLVGLLGGALVSLLVISTTLAQGSFRITNLQEQNANLVRQEQTLTNEVAQAGNPAVIAQEAEQLGMRPNPNLGFIDLKTGKIVVGKPSRAEAAINVPGFNP